MISVSIVAELSASNTSPHAQLEVLRPQISRDIDVHFISREMITDQEVALLENASVSPRVSVHNSLSDAVNSCAGEILLFLGSGSSLHPEGVERVRRITSQQTEIAVWYSTQVHVQSSSKKSHVKRLPHFSPERLLGDNYLRSGFIARRTAVLDVASQIRSTSTASLYELILRLTHVNPLVGHISAPVFIENSIEDDRIISKNLQNEECEVVRNELAHRNIDAQVCVESLGSRRIQRAIFRDPLVSIVIPTGTKTRNTDGSSIVLVEQCVKSILKTSTYENYEILLVQDQTKIVSDALLRWEEDPRITVIPYSKAFNFADKCNLGFVHSRGDFVIFLNDDTKVISSDWIETLIGHLQDMGVGASAPTLLFEDGRVQSASICNNPAPHDHGAGQSIAEFSSHSLNQIAREVSGVTGACIAIRRAVYSEVGGMSVQFPNNFNDIDLCFKLLHKSYRIIWTPFAQLTHFEAQSRNPNVAEHESQLLRSRWGRFFNNDKFTPA